MKKSRSEHEILTTEFINKDLSRRETEVTFLAVEGLTVKEMSEKLFITEKGVKFHLTNIYKKFDTTSRPKLMRHCHLEVMGARY